MIFIGAEQVIDLAMQYGSINFIFAFVFLIDFLMSSILRSEGAMKRATVIMAIGCILNGAMDPIFIYYLNMGVSGAAVSSVVASFISILIACYWIFIKKDTHVKISLDHFNPNSLLTKEILNVGIPATLEGITMDISTIIINYMLMIVGGSVAVAIFTAGFKIISLSLIPAMGVEFAILTVAGMSFGAGMYEKIKSCYHYSIKFSTLICVIIAVLMFIFSNDLAIIFSQDISLVQGISEFIKILSIGVIAIPIGLCSTAMFQAKGNGIMSLILVLLRDIILGVVFAIIFGFILNMGVFGIFLGISVGYIVAGIISYISFEIYYNRLSKS